jgi:hypothetical protein
MKKLFLSICLAAVGLLAFAKPPKKNNSDRLFTYAANENLKIMYGKVQDLSWSKAKDDLLRADFTIEEEKHSAFFSADGRHVATTTEVTIEQMPAAARKAVKSKSEGVKVLGLVQYSSETETAYYLEVSDGSKNTIYKVTGSGLATRFR